MRFEEKNIYQNIFQNFKIKICSGNVFISSLWLFLYSSLPSLILATGLFTFIWIFHPNLAILLGPSSNSSATDIFPLLIFNPLVETIFLIFLIKLFIKVNDSHWAIFTAAIFLASLHSLLSLLWGAAVFIYFLIQASAFYISEENKKRRAFFMLWISHILHNFIVCCLLITAQHFAS